MIDKSIESAAATVEDIPDGARIMIGGIGTAGMPDELIDALIDQGATDLTIINSNASNGEAGWAELIREGLVRKIICSFPRQPDSHHFDQRYRAAEIKSELVPHTP